MPQAPTLAEMEQMSEEELRAKHDAIATGTHVGLTWYRDEIDRRRADRLSNRIWWLTFVVGLATLVQTIAAVAVWIQA